MRLEDQGSQEGTVIALSFGVDRQVQVTSDSRVRNNRGSEEQRRLELVHYPDGRGSFDLASLGRRFSSTFASPGWESTRLEPRGTTEV